LPHVDIIKSVEPCKVPIWLLPTPILDLFDSDEETQNSHERRQWCCNHSMPDILELFVDSEYPLRLRSRSFGTAWLLLCV